MLKIQKFLKNRSFKDLKSNPFNLHISFKDNLILFKYNQFNSDFGNKIVQEARGLILEKDTWKIVCHPFHKFFNFGETYAFNNINLKESYIIEKTDGSLLKIYYYDGWRVATNGTIDADDAFTDDGVSFKKLFFDIISKENFNKLCENFDKENTYLFEMIHPSKQIVVDYKNLKELVFLGMIKNETEDITIDYDIFKIRKKMEKAFKNLPIRYPRVFNNNINVSEISELSNIADHKNINGNDFEGFVVAQRLNDIIVGRVKIKSPKYVYLHHMSNTNNLIDVLRNDMNEFEVYLSKLPISVVDEYKILKNKYLELINYLSKEGNKYREMAKHVNRKELAININKYIKRKEYVGFIFKMVDNPTVTPVELLKNISSKKFKSLLI